MSIIPPELLQTRYLTYSFPQAEADMPQQVLLGWEQKTGPGYSWQGLERPDGPLGIFQYTLAGRGVLERDGVRHILTAGDAFLVAVPDDHHYYLPAGWEPWEFLFLCFDGEDVLRQTRRMLQQHGPIFTLTPAHPALAEFAHLARLVASAQLPDVETLAALLYRFTLALRRSCGTPPRMPRPPVARAIHFIAQHAAANIGIDELARAARLSRAHFSRLFHQETGLTPSEYLQVIRLQRAASLLRGTMLSIEAVAEHCGFVGASYFGKVFRKMCGITPHAYRQGAQPAVEPQSLLRR
jgi:AraC-like DNA-binding protein